MFNICLICEKVIYDISLYEWIRNSEKGIVHISIDIWNEDK